MVIVLLLLRRRRTGWWCCINNVICDSKHMRGFWPSYFLASTQLTSDLWPSYCRPRTGHRWSCQDGRGRRKVQSARNQWYRAPGPAEQHEAHTCCLKTAITHRSSRGVTLAIKAYPPYLLPSVKQWVNRSNYIPQLYHLSLSLSLSLSLRVVFSMQRACGKKQLQG